MGSCDDFLADAQKAAGTAIRLEDAMYGHSMAEWRNSPHPEGDGLARLDFALHSTSCPDDRKKFFPSKLDVGSKESSPGDRASYDELMLELQPKPVNGLQGERALSQRKQHLLGSIATSVSRLIDRTVDLNAGSSSLDEVRAVKLFHRLTKLRRRQMFDFLEDPANLETPTLDFFTTGNSPRNRAGHALVDDLVCYLGNGLDADLRRKIDAQLLTAPKLLQAIAIDDALILSPLYAALGGDDEALASAFERLADAVVRFRPTNAPSHAGPIERLYIRVRSLQFLHHVELSIRRNNADRPAILDAGYRQDIDHLYEEIRNCERGMKSPSHPFVLLDGVQRFVEQHGHLLAKAVQQITKTATTRGQLVEELEYSRRILYAALLHRCGSRFPKDAPLSLNEILSALCTIREQKKYKWPEELYWHGISSSEKLYRTLGHLKIDRSLTDLWTEDYIPEGALQALYDRYWKFLAAAEGRSKVQSARHRYEIARLSAIADCLRLRDFRLILSSLVDLERQCRRLVDMHIRLRFPEPSIDAISAWLDQSVQK